MAEKGISHMIYCWSEGVFKCWVICQTQLRSEAGQGCSQNLRSVFGQQTRLKLREHPSLRQTLFILFPFIHFSSLWRAFAAVDSSVYGIWNVTLSPQSLCAFVPVNQFTLATTGIPKTRRMWYLSKSPGFIKAVIPLCNDVIHIQVELLVYAFFFSFLPIYSKIESWEACKNGSLAVIRQAGSFQHANGWKEETHSDQKAPEVSSSRTVLPLYIIRGQTAPQSLNLLSASTKYDTSCCTQIDRTCLCVISNSVISEEKCIAMFPAKLQSHLHLAK